MKCDRIVFYFILVFLNVLLADSPVLLLLTFVQVVYIYYLIIRKKFDYAILWHMVFTITSVTPTTLLIEGGSLYGYSSFKIISSLTFSYLNTVIFILLSIKHKITRDNILYRLFKLLLILFIMGVVNGGVGVLIRGYFVEYFVIHAFYMFMILLNILLLLLRNTARLQKLLSESITILLIVSPMVTTIVYYMGLTASYGSFDALRQTEIDFYSIALIFALPYIKQKKITILSLICLFHNIFVAGGGREIIIIMAAFILFLYFLFRGKFQLSNKTMRRLKAASVVFIVSIIMFIVNVALLNKESIFAYKMEDVISLFSMFSAKDIYELSGYVSQSPYVRIASLINIFNDGISSPWYLFFGFGYGGYFTDSLGMFSHLTQLEDGGWPLLYVQLGKYPYAHDSIAMIPLMNGIFGLAIVLSFALKEMKEIKNNFLLFALFPFLLVSLYFSITFGIVAVVMIFGSIYLYGKSEIRQNI